MLGSLLAPLFRKPSAYSATSSSPSRDSEIWSISNRSSSGVTVTPETATTISAVFNAVTLLSDAVKILPLFVYKRTAGGKERAASHSTYRLLHDAPNSSMSPSRLKKLLMNWVLLWGSAPCEIERNMRGDPIALWPFHPCRRTKERTADGIVHAVRLDSGRVVRLPDEDVFEVIGYSHDGVNGISIIGLARESLGFTVSAEEYGARFFARDAAPQVVLEHPGKLSEEARAKMRSSWVHMFGAGGQGDGVAILQEGMKVNRFGMPNGDAQFLETRTFQIGEVARWFNVPPHKLKELSRATFSNIEHQSIEYAGDSVLPWLVEIEEECDRKLLRTEERATYFAEFLVDALLRADAPSRAAAFQIQRQNGVINANEWREKENLNSIGPDGDEYIIPANFRTYSEARAAAAAVPEIDNPAPPVEPDEDDTENAAALQRVRATIVASHGDMIADAMARMRSIELAEAKRAATKPEKFSGWCAEFYDRHKPRVRAALYPAVRSLESCLGSTDSSKPDAKLSAGFVDEYVAVLASSMREWFAANPCDATPIETADCDRDGAALASDFLSGWQESKL